MSSGNRLFVIAVRGFLIGLLLAPVALNAQEKPEEQPPPVEESERAAPKAPAPDNKAAESPAQQKAVPTEPLPAPAIQSERPAEPACDARCQATEQREKDDLEAQRSMAEAAFDLVDISWWQFGAGIVGLIALGFTLKYTRDTARAAQKTVDVSVAIELPILQVINVEIGRKGTQYADKASRLRDALLTITVQNFGKTPAFIHHVVINADVCLTLPDEPNYTNFTWLTGTRPLPIGEKTDFYELTYGNEGLRGIENVINGKSFLWVYGFVEYFDFLGDAHRRGFCASWDLFRGSFNAERNPKYDYLEDRDEPIETPNWAESLKKALEKAQSPNHDDRQ